MVVTRDPGEVFLLRTGMGPDVTCTVERIDPDTLEAAGRFRAAGRRADVARAASPPTPTAPCTWCSATTPTG